MSPSNNKGKHNFVKPLHKSVDSCIGILKGALLDDEQLVSSRVEVRYWKSRIFYITAAIILVFGAPLMLLGAYTFYYTGYTLFGIVEALVYIISAFVLTNKRISLILKNITWPMDCIL